jgi:hypothetical protein
LVWHGGAFAFGGVSWLGLCGLNTREFTIM